MRYTSVLCRPTYRIFRKWDNLMYDVTFWSVNRNLQFQMTPHSGVSLQNLLQIVVQLGKHFRLFWNQKIHYRLHRSPAVDPILSQMNPFATYFTKKHFNNRPTYALVSLWSPTEVFNAFLFHPHATHARLLLIQPLTDPFKIVPKYKTFEISVYDRGISVHNHAVLLLAVTSRDCWIH
jgi:hypothetical protein